MTMMETERVMLSAIEPEQYSGDRPLEKPPRGL